MSPPQVHRRHDFAPQSAPKDTLVNMSPVVRDDPPPLYYNKNVSLFGD
jgi:hypothetical protein